MDERQIVAIVDEQVTLFEYLDGKSDKEHMKTIMRLRLSPAVEKLTVSVLKVTSPCLTILHLLLKLLLSEH